MILISDPSHLENPKVFNDKISQQMSILYDEVKRTAKEFNTRGDLHAGTNIASFLRVADVMLMHGSV